MYEVNFSGFGGQGILTSGVILAQAGMSEGKKVTWLPSYGSAMRGGTANCVVKIGEEDIASPYVLEPDILIALNEPSLNLYAPTVKDGGLVIINTSIVEDTSVVREGLDVVNIPLTDIARDAGDVRAANTVVLGALLAKVAIVGNDSLIAALHEKFNKNAKVAELNTKAFQTGYDFVKNA
jgi:2-oxoglutarate ferredoxin oxidoreductase subunit gamma